MHWKIKAFGWDMVKDMMPLPDDPVDRESLFEKLTAMKKWENDNIQPSNENGRVPSKIKDDLAIR